MTGWRGRRFLSRRGIAALACLIASSAGAQTCRLSLATTVPLTVGQDGQRLSVPVSLDGHDLRLLLDTGAQTTTLSRFAVPNASELEGHGVMRGVVGGAGAQSGRVHGLHLGNLVADVEVAAIDQDLSGGRHALAGLLGMSVLGAYDIDLDVAGGELRLYDAHGDCRRPAVFIAPPFFALPEATDLPVEARLRPIITVSVAGHALRALVDTGAPVSLLSAKAARILGLSAETEARDRRLVVRGVGEGSGGGWLHIFDEVDVGDLALRNMRMVVSDQTLPDEIDMLLGMHTLRQAHIWISNSSHTVILEIPPQASPPLR